MPSDKEQLTEQLKADLLLFFKRYAVSLAVCGGGYLLAIYMEVERFGSYFMGWAAGMILWWAHNSAFLQSKSPPSVSPPPGPPPGSPPAGSSPP